jgi:hypothetical protein
MSKSARKELIESQRARYQAAGRQEKGRILDELVAATGYHRCYAMTLLGKIGGTGSLSGREPQEPRHRQGTYTAATLKALERVWALSGHLCSKRLVPFVPEFLLALERHNELVLPPITRTQILALSAATMDRHLATVRRNGGRHGLSATRPGSLLKSQIPIRTFADWEDALPGFCEADLVVHTNDDTGGDYLCTLVLTDVCLGWTECRPLLHHTQTAVKGAIKDIRRTLPYPLLGIDTDNGSEFINKQLFLYCEREGITFTRGRARKKNDQCKVEQKNGHIVRSLVGYGRYDGMHACRRLAALYHYSNPWVNFFQPSMKLIEKHRDGARVSKRYDEARTPYRRALESEDITEECKAALTHTYERLNPVQLLRQIREAQESLWKLATHPPFPPAESQISK